MSILVFRLKKNELNETCFVFHLITLTGIFPLRSTYINVLINMYYVNTGFSFVNFKQRNNFDLVVPFLYWFQPLTEYILVILRYM